MTNDHYAAYHALVTHSNPYDTLSYARYPDEVADARRAYDAACELALFECDLLDEAFDQMSALCQAKQYACIDFQQKIIDSQKRAYAAAQQAQQRALQQLQAVRERL